MKNLLVFLFLFVSLNLHSQDVFGHWFVTFTEGGEDQNIEVEFFDELVVFHYNDGTSEEFSYSFQEEEDYTIIFINNLGFYYEENEAGFTLTPAFETETSDIRFRK